MPVASMDGAAANRISAERDRLKLNLQEREKLVGAGQSLIGGIGDAIEKKKSYDALVQMGYPPAEAQGIVAGGAASIATATMNKLRERARANERTQDRDWQVADRQGEEKFVTDRDAANRAFQTQHMTDAAKLAQTGQIEDEQWAAARGLELGGQVSSLLAPRKVGAGSFSGANFAPGEVEPEEPFSRMELRLGRKPGTSQSAAGGFDEKAIRTAFDITKEKLTGQPRAAAPRNIDPNSPEGIEAAIERERRMKEGGLGSYAPPATPKLTPEQEDARWREREQFKSDLIERRDGLRNSGKWSPGQSKQFELLVKKAEALSGNAFTASTQSAADKAWSDAETFLAQAEGGGASRPPMAPPAAAPAPGGSPEPSPEELREMDAAGMRWDPATRTVVPK